MFNVDLDPFAVNLATNGLLWQKSSPWIEYDCLGKSVQGYTLMEVGLAPVIGTDEAGVVIYLYFNEKFINVRYYFN